jgi:hypothetical protein
LRCDYKKEVEDESGEEVILGVACQQGGAASTRNEGSKHTYET